MPNEVNLSTRKTVGYYVVRTIVRSLWTVMFRPIIRGAEHIPVDGPIVIAPVHRSNVDFALAVFVTPRKTFFMAKDSLWKVPVLRWLISTMGAFPVKRGTADRESLDVARQILRDRQPLVLFPEGTRQSGPQVTELHMGAAFIAHATGAQIVPVGIAGTEEVMPKGAKFPRPHRISIVVGEPIAVQQSEGRTPRSEIQATTEALRVALQGAQDSARALLAKP
jgi:1-acyl-sn-glycerol-3-phosphate acyltransferase